jgi:hypothetical protein
LASIPIFVSVLILISVPITRVIEEFEIPFEKTDCRMYSWDPIAREMSKSKVHFQRHPSDERKNCEM